MSPVAFKISRRNVFIQKGPLGLSTMGKTFGVSMGRWRSWASHEASGVSSRRENLVMLTVRLYEVLRTPNPRCSFGSVDSAKRDYLLGWKRFVKSGDLFGGQKACGVTTQ